MSENAETSELRRQRFTFRATVTVEVYARSEVTEEQAYDLLDAGLVGVRLTGDTDIEAFDSAWVPDASIEFLTPSESDGDGAK